MSGAAPSRYGAVAIVLHWAIAAALIGNLVLGWWMSRAIEVAETQARAIVAFQLHKSLGLTVLVLSLVRLVWRLAHRPPPPPAGLPRWERAAAAATHWAFYLLLLVVPLTGWVYVSAQWRDGAALNVPTLWFGWFEVPHLFGLNHAAEPVRAMVSRNAGETHETLAWGATALLAIHVGAALKHHFVARNDVLLRMLPRWQSGERGRAAVLMAGFAGVIAGVVAMLAALFATPYGAVAFRMVEGGPLAAPVSGRWVFEPAHGVVRFTVNHAGNDFDGQFTRWRAELKFDPDDLAASSLVAEIETASATDGVALHDETLPLPEWFDVLNHPLARFRSRAIRAGADSGYAIDGVLTIKDRELPVTLALSFDSQGAHVSGRFEVDRVAANLGLESDPAADWVSRRIGVTVHAAGKR